MRELYVQAAPIDQENQLALLKDAHRAYAGGAEPAALIAITDELLKNDPSCDEALFLAGVAHMRLGNDGLALQFLNVASRLKPEVHAIWHNMARCLNERHPHEAYRALQRAQELKRDDQDSLIALCNVCSQIGRHAEAVEHYRRAVEMYGPDDNASVNAAFALLHMGQWEEAWKLYRASVGSADRKQRNYHAGRETPRWRPGKFKGGVVALYGEQGIGDEIMFASMIPAALEAAEAEGARIVIECDWRNEGLFARSFPGARVYGTRAKNVLEWPADEGVTHRLEFGGLGEYFAPEPFRRGGYLAADAARRAMWGAWLKSSGESLSGRLRVGIAWTGGSWATGRSRRSVPFTQIVRLIRNHPDIDFVCLEYEDRREDLAMLDAPNVLNPHWATRKGADYDDAAALVSECGLIISATTSIVDLAGALGKECWALVDEHPPWRYSEAAGMESMWFYESVRCIRQQEWGRWEPVIDVASVDLTRWKRARRAERVTPADACAALVAAQ